MKKLFWWPSQLLGDSLCCPFHSRRTTLTPKTCLVHSLRSILSWGLLRQKNCSPSTLVVVVSLPEALLLSLLSRKFVVDWMWKRFPQDFVASRDLSETCRSATLLCIELLRCIRVRPFRVCGGFIIGWCSTYHCLSSLVSSSSYCLVYEPSHSATAPLSSLYNVAWEATFCNRTVAIVIRTANVPKSSFCSQ